MVVQQVIKIEYSLLQWINRGRAGDVFVEVEFLPEKDWQPFPFTPGTGQLTEKAVRSEAGVSYKTEVKWIIQVCFLDFQLLNTLMS